MARNATKKASAGAKAKQAAEDHQSGGPADGASSQMVAVHIGEQSLRALLKQDDNYANRMNGLNGELREAIGNAVDKKHLHKKAYALLKKLHRMKSNEELAELWHTLILYMDMAGVAKRIDSVQRLAMGDDGDEDEAGEDDDGDGDGEKRVPQFGAAQARRDN